MNIFKSFRRAMRDRKATIEKNYLRNSDINVLKSSQSTIKSIVPAFVSEYQ